MVFPEVLNNGHAHRRDGGSFEGTDTRTEVRVISLYSRSRLRINVLRPKSMHAEACL